MVEQIHLQGVVSPELSGKRLDQALALLFPDYSRSRLQGWIREGRVHVDGKQRKPKEKVWPGERIVLQAVLESVDSCQPEAIPLDLLYEDEHLLVVNKPAGLVVHPAAGNWSGTLQNALLHHDPALAGLPRGGIVHRLDKDTTGLLVVARNLRTHKRLVELLQAREIKREYMAVVNGLPAAGGTVDAPIGRHPVNRVRMAVVASGKPARTHYRIKERFRNHSLLDVQLESGRTHQIRVHMAYIHYPLLGDPVYGGRLKLPSGASDETIKLLQKFGRQALHARRLSLVHPVSGQAMAWESPLPEDFSSLLEGLRQDREEHGT
ncbi:23S rRNA pseudouridine(1911/1915/1917) synthase RluD [Thiolapillus brandeum]|uniref:23S rRNA pseudouridine(1911/1915/1917) synthase RluD n=1 Tax=Thiolapillus brandeum TaxID=1076588 RepID=UPI000597DE39|nr:23S rRNA pseudouridine(1911/1915/1917) synthase RluD [Thiolapillus brandeum]